jgi:predicted outer membrane repeat protein
MVARWAWDRLRFIANISDAIFIDNRAEGIITSARRACRVRTSPPSFARSSSANYTARSGGAVSSLGVLVEESTFCDNVASQDGGALYASLGQVRAQHLLPQLRVERRAVQ